MSRYIKLTCTTCGTQVKMLKSAWHKAGTLLHVVKHVQCPKLGRKELQPTRKTKS